MNKQNPRLSPFSREYWVQRGHSIEESDNIRNSFRPIRKEYWLKRGYSEEESLKLAEKTKNENNKKGGQKNATKDKEELYKSSVRRKEYWIERGYSEQDAVKKVSEIQSTFSLEKCIEKHGIEIGLSIWKNRQEKWQKTLSSKTAEEIKKINKNKNSYMMKSSIEETIDFFRKTRNMILFSNFDDFYKNIENDLENNPNKKYWLVEKYVDSIPKLQLKILNCSENQLIELLKSKFIDDIFIQKSGSKQAYNKWTKIGLLRSSFEIYFYDKFTTTHQNKKISIDKPYPNSSMRYDFFIDEKHYIEICPEYDTNENYRIKMQKKKKIFNCILLKSIKEIDDFIHTYA